LCKRAGLLVGWDEKQKRALIAHANCDSWTCDECAKRMKDNWLMRAQIGIRKFKAEGCQVYFVTLTSHEMLATWEACERVWRKAWPVLYAALKRKDANLQYLMTPEQHEDGRMHMHALWTANVTQRWLKDNARSRGMGYMVDVSQVRSELSASRYLAKYLSKQLGNDVPKRFRRVRTSQGWPDIPAPQNALVELKWEYISGNGLLLAVYRECEAKGYDLIDVETGEFFDDVDLGTIAAPA